jgi:hypothetical protein
VEQSLESSAHLPRWGVKRALGAFLLGGALAWVLWTATAFPLGVNDEVLQIAYGATPVSPLRLLVLSTPISTYGMYQLLHPWLLPVLLLYFAPPFAWGVSARRWWVPGLAYGLGGVLTNPWPYVLLRQSGFVPDLFYTASLLVWAALPLAVLASGLGALWCRLSPRLIASASARMGRQAARTDVPTLPEQRALLQSQRSSGELLARRSLPLAWGVVALLGVAILALQVFSFLRLWVVR